MSLVPLRVLIVEDSDNDAQLLLRELRKNGYDVSYGRVETEEAARSALADQPWDVVISDYTMPEFSATAALKVVLAAGLDIPFIIVSGTIGEETAVEALKLGAQDFMIKGRLARLGPAVERALADVEARRIQRETAALNRASEARFSAIMNTSKDAVISADSSGAITYANPAAVGMFGYAEAELLGMHLTRLIPAIDMNDAARSRAITELLGRTKDGSDLPVELSLATWTANEERHFVSIVRDVTDRKRVEAQLLVADRMATLGSLAASVAHEINNPLAAVLANAELAIRDLGELPPDATSAPIRATILEELTDAREAAGRVREIVRDLRVFSRGEDQQPELVDIERVLESTLRLASNEVRHRATVIKAYTAVPAVHGTEARLGQVFLNLIMNAAQAIPSGHVEANTIRIATRFEAGRVIVEVADSGEGIQPEILRRLFTPFLTTKPAGVGTGLGLSICHRIVTGYGGEIIAESVVGRGTVFKVSLLPGAPVVEDGSAPARPGERARRRGRVLVIDDEVLIGKAVARMVASEHDVVVSRGGREALEKLSAGERYDVILCDVMMPDLTGLELYEQLLRIDPRQAACTVFLTGGAFSDSVRDFLERVPNARLDKPFSSADVRKLINDRVR